MVLRCFVAVAIATVNVSNVSARNCAVWPISHTLTLAYTLFGTFVGQMPSTNKRTNKQVIWLVSHCNIARAHTKAAARLQWQPIHWTASLTHTHTQACTRRLRYIAIRRTCCLRSSLQFVLTPSSKINNRHHPARDCIKYYFPHRISR